MFNFRRNVGIRNLSVLGLAGLGQGVARPYQGGGYITYNEQEVSWVLNQWFRLTQRLNQSFKLSQMKPGKQAHKSEAGYE